jgi:hypothetical protein
MGLRASINRYITTVGLLLLVAAYEIYAGYKTLAPLALLLAVVGFVSYLLAFLVLVPSVLSLDSAIDDAETELARREQSPAEGHATNDGSHACTEAAQILMLSRAYTLMIKDNPGLVWKLLAASGLLTFCLVGLPRVLERVL